MKINNIYDYNPLQERQDASPVLNNSGTANIDVAKVTKRNNHCRGENTRNHARSNVDKYMVFVLSKPGKPLTPTTSSKARKLLKSKQAVIVWSKFNTFGIQLLTETREEIPITSLGIDNGTKYEGYAVVCNKTNNLAVKLDLPDKNQVVKKLDERRMLRKNRRNKLRRRPARFNNRNRKGFIAPSQMVIINSRLKIIKEFCKIYPINIIGFEDVRFNHAKYKWGSNFSTVEIGKSIIKKFFEDRNIKVIDFKGYETKALREKYGYKKTSSKSANKFESHCTDALSLAVEVNCGERIESGRFIVVNDTYRCIRRKLHYTTFKKGGIRKIFSTGTVFGLRKGLLICSSKGKIGQLCGMVKNNYRYYDLTTKRKMCKKINWISSNFAIGRQYAL